MLREYKETDQDYPTISQSTCAHNRRTMRACDLPDMAVIRNPEEVIATHL
jgi:hypothetical protein